MGPDPRSLTAQQGPAAGEILLRDARRGCWRLFARPVEILTTTESARVPALLRRIDEAVQRDGLCAAGGVSYEAAPAFDSALVVRPDDAFPRLWFGLYATVEEVALPALEPGEAERPGPAWQPSISEAAYRTAFEQIRERLCAGETYQVNFTHRLRAAFETDPWLCFRRLMSPVPARYGAYANLGEWVACCASPELFFERDGDHVESRPMKGTQPRGRTGREDEARKQQLADSEKDRAENVMIADMVRNDLSRVADRGSVTAPVLCAVEKHPSVWQMTSTVQGRTACGLAELFGALFPPASITGAPKPRTMQIIAELEDSPRRLYTGTLGFVLPERRAQFNVAIRTVLVNRRTAAAEYGVGGGIVWDSDCRAEWQECRTKARILRAAVPPFSLLETMRWTAGEGFHALDRHLERLQASAAYFDFPVDIPAILRTLDETLAASAGLASARVRLTLSREGAIGVETGPLPVPAAGQRPRVALAAAPIDRDDPFLYHKTTHRAVYNAARASRPDVDDVILWNEAGDVTESTIANVAVEHEGVFHTPPVAAGLLAGTERARLLAEGRLVEHAIPRASLPQAGRLYLLNSVRGLWPVDLVP